MKLGEALILRADLKKRSNDLQERLRRNAKVQEGNRAAERLQELFNEFDGVAAELEALARRVNWTNTSTLFEGSLRISDAIAMRNTLDLRIQTLRAVIETASNPGPFFLRSDAGSAILHAAALEKQLDDLRRKRLELDTRIQTVNWQVDLLVINL